MKNGKVSESVLKRSVLRQLHSPKPEGCTGPGVGIDGAALPLKEQAVLASACVAIPSANQAARAVISAINNLSATGAIPRAVLTTVTIPTLWNEAQLRELMRDLDAAAAAEGTVILGGHTQASRSVKNAVLTVTAIGETGEAGLLSASEVRPGMDLILTGWIAMDGTGLLAAEEQEQLRSRFSQPFIDRAAAFRDQLGIRRAAEIARRSGAAAMHDLSEGGVFGALWELAEAAGVGLEIDLRAIPIRQETVEICEFFDINPYKLLSAGSLLIAATDGNRIVRDLVGEGIPAVIIGKATDGNDRLLLQEGERRFLETTQTDEIYKVLDK